MTIVEEHYLLQMCSILVPQTGNIFLYAREPVISLIHTLQYKVHPTKSRLCMNVAYIGHRKRPSLRVEHSGSLVSCSV